ncbi:MAG: GMC family oxidoreductase N-terminal domain-containing protein [Tagaea sp.]|nr:GMC family oxidoreductase N-terminal domain-containing protein [Tagaea sp.]
MDSLDAFDYLIVGGGSAGCVLAGRLSACGRYQVGLLEAGPDTPPEEMPEAIVAEQYLPDYFDPSRYWTGLGVHRDPVGNRSMAEIAARAAPARYEQARVMGGGSSVNGQVALRGIPADYDEWARSGAAGWSWRECLPYFRKLERDMDFAGELHGRDGPIPIRRTFPKDWGGFALALRDALAQAGVPYRDDANAEPDDGCFPFPRNNVYGRRVTTAMAYLDNAARMRPNLRVIPNALVERIEFDGRRAAAVLARLDGVPARLKAREIVVCAGAIHSPALLLRSGLGPADELAELGIVPVADLPGVGRNLQDHPLVGIGAHLKPEGRMRRRVSNPFLIYARFSSGLEDCPRQDMKISLANRFDPSPIGEQFAVVRVGPDKAFSRGYVRLKSADPLDEPFVAFNLLGDWRDRRRMRDGVRFVHRLLTSAPVGAVSDKIFVGAYTDLLRKLRAGGPAGRAMLSLGAAALDSGAVAREAILRFAFPRGDTIHAMAVDDDLLDAWVAETVLGNWHACGTCRMGAADDPAAAVDPRGRVRAVEGLRVADASIMPTVPRANTNISTIMIGEKIADHILKDD